MKIFLKKKKGRTLRITINWCDGSFFIQARNKKHVVIYIYIYIYIISHLRNIVLPWLDQKVNVGRHEHSRIGKLKKKNGWWLFISSWFTYSCAYMIYRFKLCIYVINYCILFCNYPRKTMLVVDMFDEPFFFYQIQIITIIRLR